MTRYLHALPYALPAFGIGLAIAFVVATHLARRLGERRVPIFCWLSSLALVASLTLTPSGHARSAEAALPSSGVWIWALPNLGAFAGVNWQSMNLLMFLPLGIACGLLTRRSTIAWGTVAAFAVSVLVELIQYAAPVLARSQFNSATVLIGWMGIIGGLTVTLILRWLLAKGMERRHREPSTVDSP
ncbi:VanZ family protein [Brevibacterium casei]|uniref:VanZ like family protein n=2 Tax=Brevibacterium casei TaxID=33889 RepID=A0A2H1KIV2_9MICO|nr:VanZ family protein [Brevibacterium casei]MCT1552158.1 VanZ family protein [Brevibacterium casei]MCT1562058.1 VanZ family protein [Brevibacterium casei]MCT1767648.1 VanZ family protein [Brevibacterium casei]MCT2209876.1 VanZ family protein [Brevibacterium casei]MCT2360046.1 VanZ family protein [Brevibacterium casei]